MIRLFVIVFSTEDENIRPLMRKEKLWETSVVKLFYIERVIQNFAKLLKISHAEIEKMIFSVEFEHSTVLYDKEL